MPFDYECSHFDYEIRPFEHVQTLRAIMKAINKRFSIKSQEIKESQKGDSNAQRTRLQQFNINAAP